MGFLDDIARPLAPAAPALLGETKEDDIEEGENEMHFAVRCAPSRPPGCCSSFHPRVAPQKRAHAPPRAPAPPQVDRIDVGGIAPSTLSNAGLLVATLVTRSGAEVLDVNAVVQVAREGDAFSRCILDPLS